MGPNSKITKRPMTKIAISLLIATAATLIISVLDNKLIKPNAIILLDNYDDINLVVWQVQSASITLIIAFVSFFVNKLKETFYGMTASELLTINRKRLLQYNIIDYALLAISLNVCTFIAIISKSMCGVVFIAILELLIIIRVVYISLMVAMNDNYINNIAAEYVNNIFTQAIKNDLTTNQYGYPIYSDAQNSLLRIIDKIFDNINTELLMKKSIDLYKNEDFMFVIKIFRDTKDTHAQISDYCVEKMQVLQGFAINSANDSLAEQLTNWILACWSKNKVYQSIISICNGYYHGKISKETFSSFTKSQCHKAIQSLDDNFDSILVFTLSVIRSGDTDTFIKIVQSTLKYMDYSHSHLVQKFVQVILAYSYYLLYKEPLFLDEQGKMTHSNVRNMIKLGVMVNGKEYKLSRIITDPNYCMGIPYIFKQDDNDNINLDNWEYSSIGTWKKLHLEYDIAEYALFYAFTFYSNEFDFFREMTLERLVDLRKLLTNDGKLNDLLITQYNDFIVWIEANFRESNIELVQELDKYIKVKALMKAKNDRSDIETRMKKIDEINNSILSMCENSPLYSEAISDNADTISLEHIDDIDSFSKHVSLIDRDNVIYDYILISLFNNISHMMYPCRMSVDMNSDTENIKKFNQLISRTSKNIKLNTNFNETISDHFEYHNISLQSKSALKDFDTSVKQKGRWPTGRYSLIYIDSTIFYPQFSLSQNISEYIEWLSDAEINQFIREKLKCEEQYILPVSPNLSIPSSFEECYEFIKQSKFKQVYKFKFVKPIKNFGIHIYFEP